MRSNFVCHLISHIHEDMPNLSPKEASMRKLKNADFQMSHHLDWKMLERFFRGSRATPLRTPQKGLLRGSETLIDVLAKKTVQDLGINMV